MAVFNAERFLEEQLSSLLAQTHKDWQLIVRDNHSTDDTLRIISDFSRQHPSRINLLPGDGQNVGAAQNFARLLNEADCDYVMFADADDVWLPHKIERTLATMQHTEAMYSRSLPILIHSDLTVVDRQLRILGPSFWRYQNLNPVVGSSLNRLLIQNVVTGCTMMLNRALVERTRPIPPEAIMHDWWTALVAAALGRIESVNEPLMLYRQHGGNQTGARKWNARMVASKMSRVLMGGGVGLHMKKTQLQARMLLKHLGANLEPAEATLIGEFATLNLHGPIERRRILWRNAFFRHGVVSNLGLFLLV